jgi:hypothetical protein
MGTGILSQRQNSWCVKLTSDLYLVSRLTISGATTLLFLYVFMVWPDSLFCLLWVQQCVLKSTTYNCILNHFNQIPTFDYNPQIYGQFSHMSSFLYKFLSKYLHSTFPLFTVHVSSISHSLI